MINRVEIAKAIIDYVEVNLDKKPDLDIIASAVGYSKYHMHRLFKRTVGISVQEYAGRRRLTEAARHLAYSQRPVWEIAMDTGYESQQAFSDIFKKMYKTTPKKFRKRGEFYPLQLPFVLSGTVPALEDHFDKRIATAEAGDAFQLLSFAMLIIDGFPNLRTDEFTAAMEKGIGERRVLVLRDMGRIAAAMLFNGDNIEFFGVHPLYRNQGVEQAFISRLGHSVSVTTFREGDRADTGYRKLYKELGFEEGELLTEFGYPTQRFVLRDSHGI